MLLYIIDRRKVGIEMIKPIMKDVLFLAQKSHCPFFFFFRIIALISTSLKQYSQHFIV